MKRLNDMSRKDLLAELSELEWELDPLNNNPCQDIPWVIGRKLKIQDRLEELEKDC
jgi:hypothetical protein